MRFFTEDSRRYITPREALLQREGYAIRPSFVFDGILLKYHRPQKSVFLRAQRQLLSQAASRSLWYFQQAREQSRRGSAFVVQKTSSALGSVQDRAHALPVALRSYVTPQRAWNASLLGAVAFGMFSMSVLYHYFGQGVLAKGSETQQQPLVQREAPRVLGVDTLTQLHSQKESQPSVSEDQQAFFRQVRTMVKGYPIEKMLPYILDRDPQVAAFMIAIAKKESNWGKRVPVLNGEDCFNYWGYRGKRKRMGTGGHTCFDSREDAVKTVGDRLEWLIKNKKRNTPEKLIVWKCGYSCAGHSPRSVRKWIQDVDLYYSKLIAPLASSKKK